MSTRINSIQDLDAPQTTEIEVGETHRYCGKTRVLVRKGDELLTILSTKSDGYEIQRLTPNPLYGRIGHSNEKSHTVDVLATEPDLRAAKITAVAILSGELDSVADYDGSWSPNFHRFDDHFKASTKRELMDDHGFCGRSATTFRAMLADGVWANYTHWFTANEKEMASLKVAGEDIEPVSKDDTKRAESFHKTLAGFAKNATSSAEFVGCRKGLRGSVYLLLKGANGNYAAVDAKLVADILARHPKAIPGIADASSPVCFWDGAQCVGGVMTIELGAEPRFQAS